MKRAIIFSIFFIAVLSSGVMHPSGSIPDARAGEQAPGMDPRWLPLISRLAGDGMDRERMTQLFSDLALPWSPVFMSAKILERFGSRLGDGAIGKSRPDREVPLPFDYRPPAAGGFEGAKAMLGERASLLEEVHKSYGVPPALVAAILLMESDMGHELGETLALHALASMAAAATPELALEGFEKRRRIPSPLREEVEKSIRDASAWAYKELFALIRYCETNGIDMLRMPGSIYGAIGLCQFMPSNIDAYAVDSDKKGVIDLFSLPDAAYSIANFLKEHGFSEKLPLKKQLEILRRYNHSDSYAALTLGMSYQLAGKKVPAELRAFNTGRARKAWWPKTPPRYRLPPLGKYMLK